MKIISGGEFRAHFHHVLEQVKAGEEFAITYGRKKQVVGYFLPKKHDQPKIKLGIVEGKAKFTFNPDFKMTEEEF